MQPPALPPADHAPRALTPFTCLGPTPLIYPSTTSQVYPGPTPFALTLLLLIKSLVRKRLIKEVGKNTQRSYHRNI